MMLEDAMDEGSDYLLYMDLSGAVIDLGEQISSQYTKDGWFYSDSSEFTRKKPYFASSQSKKDTTNINDGGNQEFQKDGERIMQQKLLEFSRHLSFFSKEATMPLLSPNEIAGESYQLLKRQCQRGLNEILSYATPATDRKRRKSETTNSESCDIHIRENNSNHSVVFQVDDEYVLMPPRSRYMQSDLSDIRELLRLVPIQGFECIVMDPPWHNKSVARSKNYPCMDMERLRALPIRRLVNRPGCVVAVWITNNPKVKAYVIEELLPQWGLVYECSWWWLKVTDTGDPVIPLKGKITQHRKCYEEILLARVPCSCGGFPLHRRNDPTFHLTCTNRQNPKECIENCLGHHGMLSFPTDYVIASIASRSARKPQLDCFLEPYLSSDPTYLELFARNLKAGWASWGNEPTKFQNMNLFSSQ